MARVEVTSEIRLGSGLRTKRLRILSEISIDDIMENALRAQAMIVKTGRGVAPEYDRKIRDFLLQSGRVNS
mgnify:CR=1 FL=1